MALKVANVGAVKQGRNTMSRSASERGRLGVSIGGCSFSGEWAADARLLGCTRQAGQLSRPITTEITKHEVVHQRDAHRYDQQRQHLAGRLLLWMPAPQCARRVLAETARNGQDPSHGRR